MKIIVLSKREIEDKAFYKYYASKKDGIIENHIIISITDPDDTLANITSLQECKDILRLIFDDVDEHYKSIDNNYKYFTKDQARQILKFVDENVSSVDKILVHCHAGISRSAGTAAALSNIINKSDDLIVKAKPCFNRYVYRTILNEYYDGGNKYENI